MVWTHNMLESLDSCFENYRLERKPKIVCMQERMEGGLFDLLVPEQLTGVFLFTNAAELFDQIKRFASARGYIITRKTIDVYLSEQCGS